MKDQTDRDLIRDLAEALRLFVGSAHPVSTAIDSSGKAWSKTYLDGALQIGVSALTAARERLAREDGEPSIDSVIDAYTAETGGPENFNAEVLQRFIDLYPQHAAGLRRYSVIQLTSQPATPEEIAREDQPAGIEPVCPHGVFPAQACTNPKCAQPAPEPAEPVDRTANPPVLQRLIDSIDVFDGQACWDYAAMYDVRDALYAAPPRPAPVELLSEEEIDALDTFALHVMAPCQKDSVRSFARAVEAEVRRRLAERGNG